MRNYETTARMGETGFVIIASLIDENGPVDLTGWQSINLDVKTTSGTAIVANSSCSITDVANGVVSIPLDITIAAFPNMRKGRHRMIFTGIDSSGDVHTFPKSERRPYGTLIVLEAL